MTGCSASLAILVIVQSPEVMPSPDAKSAGPVISMIVCSDEPLLLSFRSRDSPVGVEGLRGFGAREQHAAVEGIRVFLC